MKHSFALAIVLAVASLGVFAGCGGEDGSSREEFSEGLESIDQRGGERWSLLAQRAEDLKPDQPIPADVKQPISELVDFQRHAVAELEEQPSRGCGGGGRDRGKRGGQGSRPSQITW